MPVEDERGGSVVAVHIVDWGQSIGSVSGVLREMIGLSLVEVNGMMKQSRPMVVRGSYRDLTELIWALERAGASLDLVWSQS